MSTERQRQYLDALAVEQGFRDTMDALELMTAEAVRLVEQLVHDAALEPGGGWPCPVPDRIGPIPARNPILGPPAEKPTRSAPRSRLFLDRAALGYPLRWESPRGQRPALNQPHQAGPTSPPIPCRLARQGGGIGFRTTHHAGPAQIAPPPVTAGPAVVLVALQPSAIQQGGYNCPLRGFPPRA